MSEAKEIFFYLLKETHFSTCFLALGADTLKNDRVTGDEDAVSQGGGKPGPIAFLMKDHPILQGLGHGCALLPVWYLAGVQ